MSFERNAGAARLGTIVTGLLIVAAIVLVIGLTQDWFALRSEKHRVGDREEWRLTLVVNPQEFHESVEDVGDGIEGLTRKASAAGKTRTIEGAVVSVDVAQQRLTVLGEDGEQHVFVLASTTALELEDRKATLSELAPQDEVDVSFRVEDGVQSVLSVDAERPDAGTGG